MADAEPVVDAVAGAADELHAATVTAITTESNTTGAPIQILFGSLFLLPSSNLPLVVAFAAGTIATLITLYRPLMLVSVSPELAAARGVPVRLISAAYLLAMAVAVALSALTIGAILSTALLIGPAATALRLTNRPHRAFLAAAGIGVGCTCWLSSMLRRTSPQGWRIGTSSTPRSPSH